LYYSQDEFNGRAKPVRGKETMRHVPRALTATVASGLGALLLAASAGAATPQQIYRDLADNNRLDRTYSRADIERAFGSNPSIPAYAKPERSAPDRPQTRPVPAVVPTASPNDGRSLPFTGLDAALFGVVGGPLLLLGAGIRRFARGTPELG
jgi:hypothetical protein